MRATVPATVIDDAELSRMLPTIAAVAVAAAAAANVVVFDGVVRALDGAETVRRSRPSQLRALVCEIAMFLPSDAVSVKRLVARVVRRGNAGRRRVGVDRSNHLSAVTAPLVEAL